jgi:hypothetical protein
MALALPKFRWLILGAIAAGVWVVHEDMKKPRPPERVPTRFERSTEARSRPSKPVAATTKADKPAAAKPAVKAAERPVPPKPVAGKPVPQKTVAQKAAPQKAAQQKTAIALPKSVDRPPAKPQKIVTGSINRPDKPTFVQTRAKVFMRAQAKADAPIIATLEPRTVMRELARSGDWRLVMGDGRKGWVRNDYLAKPTFLPRRPKLPVAEVSQAKAPAKPEKSR